MLLTLLGLAGAVTVLFVAAVVATREGPVLAEAHPDVPDLALPDGPLRPQDLRDVRLSMVVRGYRMSEVDEVLRRTADELAERDRRIAQLEAAGQPATGARQASYDSEG